MDLGAIKLSEVSQPEENKSYVISLMAELIKKEIRFVVTKGREVEGGGIRGRWLKGINFQL